VEVAGGGFINFFLTRKRMEKEVKEIVQKADRYGSFPETGEKIILEFVSANPTGPLHIGHGRGAAIGDSLARILLKMGYHVFKEYYVNDVGNQIELLGKSVEARWRQQKGQAVPFPEGGYQGEYIRNLASEIEKPLDASSLGQWAAKKILESIEKDLADFGVAFHNWFFESELYRHNKIETIVKILKRKGGEDRKEYIKKSEDGALWFRSSLEGDEKDRVLIRRDGRPTYFASDIAYHYEKIRRGFHQIINIWGTDHHGYAGRIEVFLKIMGAPRRVIRLYQLVNLKRGNQKVSMSTRAGEFISLKEVIAEVGKDAARYFLLMRSANAPLDFDLNLAKKESPENPVYYIQYAHARISSIFREARERNISWDSSEVSLEPLQEGEEMDLIRHLLRFPSLVQRCGKNYEPHPLTAYLLSLARIFHGYYDRHRVLDSSDISKTRARLCLIKAVQIIIQNGLDLLGVSAPERM